MIKLTAQMEIKGENSFPFTLGVSELGSGALFGETIDVEAVFDQKNLLSLESEIIDRGDIQTPSFGIISTGGNLSFKDKNSKFLGLANAGLLQDGIKTEILLEDTFLGVKSVVGTYYTSNWEYDNDNRSVSVSFNDDLEEWQAIEVPELKLQPLASLLGIYDYLKDKTPKKFNFKFKDEKFKEEIERILCFYPYLKSGTLWSQWTKFCEIASCCIYKNDKDFVVISPSLDDGS